MQQRVGLARALASDPDVLLMDEAFSALDPLIRRQMQDEMMAIQNDLQKTILFITHDLNEALRIGDRVCIMKDGAVVQIGTPEEILTKPATGYVAEFVQDVDQGRVIQVDEIMLPPNPIAVDSRPPRRPPAGRRPGRAVRGRRAGRGDRCPHHRRRHPGHRGRQRPARGRAAERLRHLPARPTRSTTSTPRPAGASRSRWSTTTGGWSATSTHRHIMEEMGRVESLIDGFEREVFM